MSIQLQKFLLIFGVAGVLYWLTRPGTTRKAATVSSDPAKVKENAGTVGRAYLAALSAGETPSRLEELNVESEKMFGMRVYKKSADSSYWVMDTKGKDILKVS